MNSTHDTTSASTTSSTSPTPPDATPYPSSTAPVPPKKRRTTPRRLWYLLTLLVAFGSFLGYNVYREMHESSDGANGDAGSTTGDLDAKLAALHDLQNAANKNVKPIMSGDQMILPTTLGDKTIVYVETLAPSSLNKKTTIDTTGVIKPAQSLTVTAQAAGRVKTIHAKEWQSVSNGKLLVELDDTVSFLWLQQQQTAAGIAQLQAQRAEVALALDQQIRGAERALAQAKLNTDSTTLRHNTEITAAQRRLDQAKDVLATTKADAEKQIAELERAITNTDTSQTDTLAAQEIANREKEIAISYSQLETAKTNNQQTIEWYKASIVSQLDNLYSRYVDVITLTDDLLAIKTGIEERWKNGFGEVNVVLKSDVRSRASALYAKEQEFISLNNLTTADIPTSDILITLRSIEWYYETMAQLLYDIDTLYDDSIARDGFSDEIKAQYDRTTQSLLATIQGAKSQAANGRTSIETFLQTYETTEQIQLQQIKNAESALALLSQQRDSSKTSAQAALDRTRLNLDQQIKNAQDNVSQATEALDLAKSGTSIEANDLAVKNAQAALDDLVQSKKTKLASLDASIAQSQIGVSLAKANTAKLNITAPISGVVRNVHIEVGQEVWPGSKIADIANTAKNTIDLKLPLNDIIYLSPGMRADVTINNKTYRATIDSIGSIADANLLYPVNLTISSAIKYGIGGIASIEIPINANKKLIPLDIVTLRSDTTGIIQTLSGSQDSGYEVIATEITLGTTRDNRIELLTNLALPIITTDLSHYDDTRSIIRPYPDGYTPVSLTNQLVPPTSQTGAATTWAATTSWTTTQPSSP